MPVNETVCGPFTVLLLKVATPGIVPVTVGLNVTPKVQAAPGDNTVPLVQGFEPKVTMA